MGKKYTATFTCDRDLWFEFKTWAHSIDSSASEQISKFMRSALVQEVPLETQGYIDSIIKEQVHRFLEEKFSEYFDNHYLYRTSKLDAEIRNKDLSYLPNIEVLNPNPKKYTDTTDNTDSETIDSSFSGEGGGSLDDYNYIIEPDIVPESISETVTQVKEEISKEELTNTEDTDITNPLLIDNGSDTDNTDYPCPKSQIPPSADAKLFTDRQLKKQERLKNDISTIENWRLGKNSRVPKKIRENYIPQGNQWRRIPPSEKGVNSGKQFLRELERV